LERDFDSLNHHFFTKSQWLRQSFEDAVLQEVLCKHTEVLSLLWWFAIGDGPIEPRRHGLIIIISASEAWERAGAAQNDGQHRLQSNWSMAHESEERAQSG
jgi:hypothetical protein